MSHSDTPDAANVHDPARSNEVPPRRSVSRRTSDLKVRKSSVPTRADEA